MSEAGTEKTEISLVHLSDDVIVPEDKTKYDVAIKYIPKVLFGLFGTLGLLSLMLMGFSIKNILICAPIVFSIPFFISLGIMNTRWYEIDRNEGAILRWANKRKRKSLPPIRKNDFRVVAAQTRAGGRYGGVHFELFAQGSDRGKMIEESLFILPKGTEKGVAESLAKSVESFLLKFLNGEETGVKNKKITF
ncbi:MAG: hypothetical protein JXB48_10975 [Candidatus Latescibacteria bacterium]|nr:hypothetical protein [Candidatus Latescibacterota bacterium]